MNMNYIEQPQYIRHSSQSYHPEDQVYDYEPVYQYNNNNNNNKQTYDYNPNTQDIVSISDGRYQQARPTTTYEVYEDRSVRSIQPEDQFQQRASRYQYQDEKAIYKQNNVIVQQEYYQPAYQQPPEQQYYQQPKEQVVYRQYAEEPQHTDQYSPYSESYVDEDYDYDDQNDFNRTIKASNNYVGQSPMPPPHRTVRGEYDDHARQYVEQQQPNESYFEEYQNENFGGKYYAEPMQQEHSLVSANSLQERSGKYHDRTPSPLRNAMDDVLNSLDNLELASSVASSPTKRVGQNLRQPSSPLKNQASYHSTSPSPSPTPSRPRSESKPNQPRASTSPSPSRSPKRKPVRSSMILPDDEPKSTSPRPNTPPTKVNPPHPRTPTTLRPKQNENTVDSDSDEAPFDPHSYNSSPAKSIETSSRISPVRRTSPDQVARNDTYKSVSTVNTASLSIASSSTNPTTFSTSSAGSLGSQLKQRKEAYYRMEAGPGLFDSTNNMADHSEVPVALPTNTSPVNQKGNGKLSTTAQLKKSTGFLKKFFGGKNRSENKENYNGRNSSLGFSGRKSACSNLTGDESAGSYFDVSPKKLNSSAQSIKSTRSASSLSLKNTLRKVSSKTTLAGRNAFSSLDFHSGGNPAGISRQNIEMDPLSRTSSKAGVHDTTRWIEIYRNVHRTNTLTKTERENRKMRPQCDGSRSLEPIKALQKTGNETVDGGIIHGDGPLGPILNSRDFGPVDNKIFSIGSWPYIVPGDLARGYIASRFTDPLDQTRAAFDFCSAKLRWESALGDNDDGDYGHERYRGEFQGGSSEYLGSSISMNALSRVMQTRRASSIDIAHTFKQMCDALDIYCEVIPGYLKGIGEIWLHPGIPRPNHYWNAVVINGCWRMVDASIANPSFPTRHIYTRCEEQLPEYFYFLTRPKDLIYTHVPFNLAQEHIVPLLSHENAIALPLAGPSAFTFNIEPINFSTSLTRLEGLEAAEIEFAVPPEAEILAEVVAGNFPAGSAGTLVLGNTMEQRETKPALAQVFWEDGSDERYYRVKAILPQTHRQGALSIYIGARGILQSVKKNVLSLAFSFPIVHTGENPAFNFVIRHPTPHSDKHDIYINEPQCRDLICGNTYVFSMRQHVSRVEYQSPSKSRASTPSGHRKGRSMDLTRLQSSASNSSNLTMHGSKRASTMSFNNVLAQQQTLQSTSGTQRVKMALQAPNGKILKLQRTEQFPDGSGLFEGTAKCTEPGTWRGLIISDSGNAWSVFAEWTCA